MKKKTFLVGTLAVISFVFFSEINNAAEASFSDVLSIINQTSNTINSINRAGRGTMSTIEYGQRFQDRQQDRQDRKRAEKDYNRNAELEYYRTLQETQLLQQQTYRNNL